MAVSSDSVTTAGIWAKTASQNLRKQSTRSINYMSYIKTLELLGENRESDSTVTEQGVCWERLTTVRDARSENVFALLMNIPVSCYTKIGIDLSTFRRNSLSSSSALHKKGRRKCLRNFAPTCQFLQRHMARPPHWFLHLIVVLEKDGEDQLDRSCEKWRSVT